jgi:hypothetical protein
VNPTAAWLPNAIFNLAGGIDTSADAFRTDIINTYHTIPQLRTLKECSPSERPNGAFILSSDLRLEDILFDSVTVNNTGQADFGAAKYGGPLG